MRLLSGEPENRRAKKSEHRMNPECSPLVTKSPVDLDEKRRIAKSSRCLGTEEDA
ncbi:hypothetical protein [Variovorax sp. RA8]|uniref:hypothetical protein n=1 Tax=Variovorax sp. (strain JCM 16519 / RA8) TaxID=662548 RepID=UPI000A8BCFC8|nr:hypothetical protein [Variovorax sp. RA8]